MGQITGILRKHFKSCQKSNEAKKLADRVDKKQTRGGNAPKRNTTPKIETPTVETPTVHGIGFGHMPRHGNKLTNSEV